MEKKGKNVIRRIFLWFRKKSGNDLENSLGYEFRKPELLAHALVHRTRRILICRKAISPR